MVDIFNKYGTILITAMGQTLLLALYGLFFACIIGLIVGIMSVLKSKFCRGFALVFVNLIRGVPMIVLAGKTAVFQRYPGSQPGRSLHSPSR